MLHSPELWTRYWTALVLFSLGILQIVKPGMFCNMSLFYRRAVARLSPAQAGRVERVLEARRNAETVATQPTRYTGFLGIATAALEFVPGIPFEIPYAIYCLGGAFALLANYLYVKRATERRAAPLVRRSPFDALSPVGVAGLVACFVGVTLFGLNTPDRVGAIGVGISMLILAWIAWRIAGSQAVMFGDDPQVEYEVDEYLRVSRATGTIALACAPAVVLVGAQAVGLPNASESLGEAALAITYAGFIVAMLMNGTATRRASRKLGNGAAA